ncbi:helix-turn-helix domain-containing protein [Enterococcus sp. AZ109]|uniref:helix-turn-helix domain-containing protein n=1 Tax=Enterococcus sp. AZ109 TaxID=2774634 RepID=UPI003F203F91
MNISERIKYERKRKGWTQKELDEKLFDLTGFSISTDTIKRREKNDYEGLTLVEIQCLCEIFNIQPSDFLEEKNKFEIDDSDLELLSYGEKIEGVTSMISYSDLLSMFYIAPKNKVSTVFRYDMELRQMNRLLPYPSIHSFFSTLETLFLWLENYDDEDFKEEHAVIAKKDNVGTRSQYDPKIIFETAELITIAEGIADELGGYIEIINDISKALGGTEKVYSKRYIRKNRFF